MPEETGLDQRPYAELFQRLTELEQQLEAARHEIEDLELLLETTLDHSTTIENELEGKNQQIQSLMLSLQSELLIGRQIQADFLPESLPELAGWQLAAFFEPAREVAGDFYDAFELRDNKIAIIVADVCDKGVGAALFMALTRSLLRVLASQADNRSISSQSPENTRLLIEIPTAQRDQLPLVLPASTYDVLKAVRYANDYITANHSRANMFATLFFAVLDTVKGLVYYINAGHTAPLHLKADGILQPLPVTGPAIGIVPGLTFNIQVTQLEPTELLFIYTDGVTEARNATGELFGEARLTTLIKALQAKEPLTAEKLLNNINQAVSQHVQAALPSDDLTMFAIYRKFSKD